MKKWILEYADGTICQVFGDSEPSPETGHDLTHIVSVREVPEFKDLSLHTYTEAGWQENLEYAKRVATDLLNKKREQASLQFITSGDGKSAAYMYKKAEVDKARDFTGTKTSVEFPFAASEAASTNKTIDEVLGNYVDGIEKSITGLASVEARYRMLSDRIKSATTLAELPDITSQW